MSMVVRGRELPANAEAPRLARHLLTAILGEVGCAAETVDAAELLVSELVTNSVRHAASPVVLRIEVHGHELLVEVEDDDPSPPRLLHPEHDALGGRGIALVDALASHWGVTPVPDERHPLGKVVWFRIPF
jgi:anti-sigma regulatory factor (Ser/Thr protein kinase)